MLDIEKTSLFAGLGEDDLSLIRPLLYKRAYRAGDFLYKRGEPSENIYIVAQGEVDIIHRLNSASVALAKLTTGFFFGEGSLFGLAPRHRTDAQSQTDSEVYLLSARSFRSLEAEQPAVAAKILNNLAAILDERLTEDTIRISVLSGISRLISASETLANHKLLAQEILHFAVETIPCQQAFLGLHPLGDTHTLKIAAAIGLRPKDLPKELPVDSDPYLSKLRENKGEIIIPKALYAQKEKTAYAKLNILARAIKLEEKDIGMIVLADKTTGDFTIRNSLMLSIISGQVALALAQAYKREEARFAEELERNYIGI